MLEGSEYCALITSAKKRRYVEKKNITAVIADLVLFSNRDCLHLFTAKRLVRETYKTRDASARHYLVMQKKTSTDESLPSLKGHAT